GSEDSGWLALQLAFQPQACCRVNQLLHLGRHVAVAGWRTEDDSVRLPEIVQGADWNIGLLLTNLHNEFVVRGLSDDLLKLRNAAEHALDSRHGLRALLDGSR